MKILLSNPVVAHGAFRDWMTADLQSLGHEVSTFDQDELCEQFGIELYRRALVARVAAEAPDVLFVHPPYDLLRPHEAEAIRASGTIIVGFAYDDPIFLSSYLAESGRLAAVLAEYRRTYDLYFTTSRQMVREAAPFAPGFVRHLRWAVNAPEPPGDGVRDMDVVLVGSAYPRRVDMVRALNAAGIYPTIFGSARWQEYPDVVPHYRGMLTRPGMFAVYRRAKIALAPADWEAAYVPMVKLRSLEIASRGALLVAEACEDQADYFERGPDSYEPGNWAQLASVIRAALANDVLREGIALTHFHRLCRLHTWRARWREIDEVLRPLLPRERTRAPTDRSLPRLMGLATCAHHYEVSGDADTAQGQYEEWLAIGGCFSARLGRARCLIARKDYAEAERELERAIAESHGLCGPGIDLTVSFRRITSRIGMGKLFSGIFPRGLECYAHLLILYAATAQIGKAETLLSELAPDADYLFVAIMAVLSDETSADELSPDFLARYAEVALSTSPRVWAGERKRHEAQLWIMRGRALQRMGRKDEGAQCLAYGASLDKPAASPQNSEAA